MKNVGKVLSILEKEYPVSRTTLNKMKGKNSAFEILVSCLISLRAKDETTSKISEELFSIANTPEGILKIPVKKLKRILFSSGHYNKKAEVLMGVSRELIKRFGSKVPNNYEDLVSIKGIGPKTANIVLNFAFDRLVLPIDTHCHRVPNRIGWVNTKLPDLTRVELEKIIPKKYWREFNSIFVQFGRGVCKSVNPNCGNCVIKNYCNYGPLVPKVYK